MAMLPSHKSRQQKKNGYIHQYQLTAKQVLQDNQVLEEKQEQQLV